MHLAVHVFRIVVIPADYLRSVKSALQIHTSELSVIVTTVTAAAFAEDCFDTGSENRSLTPTVWSPVQYPQSSIPADKSVESFKS